MREVENMEEIMKFAQIVKKVKEKEATEITLSIEEREFLMELKKKYSNDTKYLEFFNNIWNAPKGDEVQVVYNFFEHQEQQNQEQHEEKSPEEEIAETFGISTSQIKHLHLKNGKEAFSFYSEELGKDIVLENDKKGKSISEVLHEIQDSDEKYNSLDEDKNANDIMMDTRLKTNLELDMYTPEEVLHRKSDIAKLNDNEKILLNFLLSNSDKLNIKSINIENLIYITNNHEIKEMKFDMNYKPVVDSPDENSNSSLQETVPENDNGEDEKNKLLDEMFNNDDENKKENDNSLEQSEAKKLVLFRPNDNGYIASFGIVAILVTVATLIMILIHAL